MKKGILFLSILFAFLGICSSVNAGHVLLQTPKDCQVTGMSPNGRYVCGSEVLGNRGFLWDLHTGEFNWLSSGSSITRASDVSDNGVVVGVYISTEASVNGAPIQSGGYWKAGKWYNLENIDGVPVTDPENGSWANGVSADGQYIVGAAYDSKGFCTPCLWKNGFLERTYPIPEIGQYKSGVAYDVNSDGSLACGWAFNSSNRATYLWNSDGGTQLADNDNYSVFHAAVKFSHNDKYIACTAYDLFIYDVEKQENIIIPPVSQEFNQSFASFVCDDKTFFWTEDGNAAIHKEGIGSMLLKNYLKEYEDIDLGELIPWQVSSVSLDGKIMTGTSMGINEAEGMIEYRGYVLLLDQNTDHPQPAYISTNQLSGLPNVKVTWDAPFSKATDVKGYNVYRNGIKLNNDMISGNIFFDNTTKVGDVLKYQVTAVYANVESEKSTESFITIVNPYSISDVPTSIMGRASGYNDAMLKWVKPIVSDGIVKWNKTRATDGLGANASGSFFFGVKFDKQILSCYPAEMVISGIEFMPMANAEFTVNMKIGNKEIYTEEIKNNIIIGEYNQVKLSDEITIGSILKEMIGDETLFLFIEVFSAEPGTFAAGIDLTTTQKGYSDLMSQDGVTWDELSELSDGTLNGSWNLGLLINGSNGGNKKLTGYNIYRDGVKVKTAVSKLNDVKYTFMDTNLSGNEYSYSVEAVYAANGETFTSKKSEPLTIKLSNNNEPCTPPVNVEAYKYGTEELNDIQVSWNSPSATEKYEMSYTNWNYNLSLTLSGGFNINAAIKFDQDKMSLYNGFEINEFMFYPVANVEQFVLRIFDDNSEIYSQEIETYTLNKKNTITLDEPVMLSSNSSLFIVLEVIGMVDGKSIAVDTSIPFPEYGDLYAEPGTAYASLWNAASIKGNWMMGVNITNNAKTSKGNNLIRYNVYMNDIKMNNSPITENSYRIEGNTTGTKHLISVAAVYTECGEQRSAAVEIQEPTGVNNMDENIRVYPNPASKFINIEGDVVSVTLLDITGKEMFKADYVKSINVENFIPGMYILNVNTGNGIITKRVAINR